MSHCYGMLFLEYVFESHYLSHHYVKISPYSVMLGPYTLMIKYALKDNNNDNDNNDHNDDDNDSNSNSNSKCFYCIIFTHI